MEQRRTKSLATATNEMLARQEQFVKRRAARSRDESPERSLSELLGADRSCDPDPVFEGGAFAGWESIRGTPRTPMEQRPTTASTPRTPLQKRPKKAVKRVLPTLLTATKIKVDELEVRRSKVP